MKISQDTISLLKNFATINQSIRIKPGNVLLSTDAVPSILARAEVAETFPVEVAIYDLHQFLGTLAMMGDCEADFGTRSVVLTANKHSTEYFYSSANLIKEASKKELKGGDLFSCVLSERDITMALKAAAVFSAPVLSFVGADGVATLNVGTPKSDTQDSPTNTYRRELGPCEKEFDLRFPVESIKVLADSYNVGLSEQLFAQFSSTTRKLQYWLAASPDSVV